jgi:hypothetical protein
MDEDQAREGEDDTNIYDVDKPVQQKKEDVQPLYRVFKGSKIPVSKSTGKMWKARMDAAVAAYDVIYGVWNECFAYYNNHQGKSLNTPRGVFKRGDSSENIVYSNLNVMLPAVYSKDPDITCNTNDEGDSDFAKTLQAVLNAFFTRRGQLNAKSKFKRAVGFALLTNFGILKIDWTRKDDSTEMANKQLQEISQRLVEAKTTQELEEIYGQIEALEGSMEIFTKSGPGIKNILPQNLIIDPNAEDDDGCDAAWQIERAYFPTAFLTAKYTQPFEGEDERDDKTRSLVYKPTHIASFDKAGKRDDGLGMVLNALDANQVTEHQNEERTGYMNLYYTECYIVWDKMTKRVFLFHGDDWTWPLWVWDDPLNISRFFPYFIVSFGMSTGGTVSVGETAYYLDQQDEINDINRQVAKIRRTVFDFFYYNSDACTKDEVEKFINAIRGQGKGGTNEHIVGVRAGEGKIADLIQAFVPPQLQAEALFNKEPIINSINRISNTSDALRGTQFKTNTNKDAVQTYQDAARMAVGAKIDVVEDVIADIANSFAEIAVQVLDQEEVTGLVGETLAANWDNMTLEEYTANYNIEVVAGTTEKKNSIFKKKEAVQIAQAIGQFASAAPLTSMRIMLRVLEQAFTEVVITPEDWVQLEKEAEANLQKGVTTGGDPSQGGGGDIKQQLMSLPPEIKQQAMQMKEQGMPDDQIKAFLMEAVQKQGGGQGAPPSAPEQQGAPQSAPQQQQTAV